MSVVYKTLSICTLPWQRSGYEYFKYTNESRAEWAQLELFYNLVLLASTVSPSMTINNAKW